MDLDPTSVVKPDLYRVVTIVLVPGFVAAAPWLAGVFWPALMLPQTWVGTAWPISVTLFGIVLVAGFVLENLGSRIEAVCLDRWAAQQDPELWSVWWRYLGLKTGDEIVGQRYIRAMLVRYKFELSMIPASLSGAAGFVVAECMGQGTGHWAKTGAIVAALIVLALLSLWEAVAGASVLARVRRVVVETCERAP